MSSMNRVILVGRVGKDPEIINTSNGKKVARLSVVTSQYYREKASGERKEKSEWHNVQIVNEGTVDIISKYVGKGDQIMIEGLLRTSKWTDKQGVERYTTSVTVEPFDGKITLMGGNKKRDDDDGDRRSSSRSSSREEPDDEIPF